QITVWIRSQWCSKLGQIHADHSENRRAAPIHPIGELTGSVGTVEDKCNRYACQQKPMHEIIYSRHAGRDEVFGRKMEVQPHVILPAGSGGQHSDDLLSKTAEITWLSGLFP